jgi:hypothetical protein
MFLKSVAVTVSRVVFHKWGTAIQAIDNRVAIRWGSTPTICNGRNRRPKPLTNWGGDVVRISKALVRIRKIIRMEIREPRFRPSLVILNMPKLMRTWVPELKKRGRKNGTNISTRYFRTTEVRNDRGVCESGSMTQRKRKKPI